MAAVVPTTSARTLIPQPNALVDISGFFGIFGASPVLVYNADVAAGELFNVMDTLVGDEYFEPLFGCDLPKRVFEPITATVEQRCLMDVFLAARDWTPHIPVDLSKTGVYATADQRVVGVFIGYQFAGASWKVDVALSAALSGNI
jgi:phage baseplate assembly protein W